MTDDIDVALTASSHKRNVMVWRLSVRLSVPFFSDLNRAHGAFFSNVNRTRGAHST